MSAATCPEACGWRPFILQVQAFLQIASHTGLSPPSRAILARTYSKVAVVLWMETYGDPLVRPRKPRATREAWEMEITMGYSR